MICENCLINPICKIGCEKLLENKNSITIEDFKKYVNLPKRLITTGKEFTLNLKHNTQVQINCGACIFRRNGKCHREGGSAVEYSNGTKKWWLNGKLHREDGPAVEYSHGTKEWYINGKLHREGGPAIEYADGEKYWYINGDLHREDGPAVEHVSGYKEWYKHGIKMV